MKNINNNNTDEIQIGDLVKHSKEYCDSLHRIRNRIASRIMIILDIKYFPDMEQKRVRVYNVRSDYGNGPDKTFEWTVEQVEKIC